ncbi:transcription elongation factor GreA [Candidatus Omnitrophota bacterium]
MPGNYLSREGYEKLREELEHLTRAKRRQLAKEIGQAREKGDLKENAEYHAAKEAQAFNEAKIAELQHKLSESQILDDDANIPKDQALIGATVKLKDLAADKKLSYTLVAELEADFSQGKISVTSPVGRGLLGHKAGETVEIKIPAGTLKYKILGITR